MKKNEKYLNYLNIMTKGIVGMAFRNGPIEDFHAEQRPIGNKEMEILNRFMVNRVGYILDLVFNDEFEKYETLCGAESLMVSFFSADEVKELEENYEIISKGFK